MLSSLYNRIVKVKEGTVLVDQVSQELEAYTYNYDEAHNIIDIKENIYGTVSKQNEYTYTYDKLNRIQTVCDKAKNKITEYSYDVPGNRKSIKVTTNGVLESRIRYNLCI